MDIDRLGKAAEKQIENWLNRPNDGYCIYRIPDQMTGFYGSKNPCDFVFFCSPELYWIESKATTHDRFDFSMITSNQMDELLKYDKINNVHGIIIVLFYEYKRAFIFNITDIKNVSDSGTKSLNIKKISKWPIRYQEIQTLPSRKQLLDYDPQQDIILR